MRILFTAATMAAMLTVSSGCTKTYTCTDCYERDCRCSDNLPRNRFTPKDCHYQDYYQSTPVQ